MTREEIDKNAETYKTQVFKILDPEKTEVRFNSEWLEPMKFDDIIRFARNTPWRGSWSGTISPSASRTARRFRCMSCCIRWRRATIR